MSVEWGRMSLEGGQRRYELDYLRVLAFGLLILYHLGMYYVEGWGWHYKSQYQSDILAIPMLWSAQWRMSLLFLISGSAVAFLLPKITARCFYISRFTRLLLPLVFGSAVVVVPQVYVEANFIGLIDGDYGFYHFWGDYLDQNSLLFTQHKTIGRYHFTWNHLWYLAYIFAYSLIACAVYQLYIALSKLSQWRPEVNAYPALVVFVAPVLWLFLNRLWVYDLFPITHALVDDFYNHGRYAFAFIFGVIMVVRSNYWVFIRRIRWFTLGAAIALYLVTSCLRDGGTLAGYQISKVVKMLIWQANAWVWILTVCGWAQRLFRRRSVIITYLNSGVYCYYILHQTLIIIFAYWLSDYALGPVFEPMVLFVLTIGGCALGFEVLKRIPYVRVLFGIGRSGKSKVQAMPVAGASVPA